MVENAPTSLPAEVPPNALPQEQNINPPPTSKRKRLIIISAIILSIALIIGTLFGYLFLFTPKTQAQVYLERTSKDFSAIKQAMDTFYSSYGAVSDSFGKSKTAFYEITENRTYDEAVADTKQDIEDINQTLVLVKQAQETRQSMSPPVELQQLDNDLANYYAKVTESLELLLEFETLQTNMLDAFGDDLNQELKNFNIVYRVGTERPTLVTYFNKVSQLASASASKHKKINIPQDLQLADYYNSRLEYTEDLATTSALVADYLNDYTGSKDLIVNEKILDFSNRNLERDNQRASRSAQFVESSPINDLFEEITNLEEGIEDEFELLKTQYEIIFLPVTETSPSPEASSSAF